MHGFFGVLWPTGKHPKRNDDLNSGGRSADPEEDQEL
jgi:hypothetical protein